MLLADVVATSEAVAATRARSEKIRILSETLRRLSPEETRVAVSYLSGQPTQRKLGVGYATAYSVEANPVDEPILEVLEVDQVLEEVSETSGAGSVARRFELLSNLIGRATESEQGYLRGLILRNLRQGALQGVMAEAVAAAVDVPAERVRRAAMLEGDLIEVAARALAEGPDGLGSATTSMFTPIQPMLARTAESTGTALAALGEALVETKLDGLRVQVHREGDRVMVFSRNLRDITAETPGIVDAALQVDAGSFILDGEGLVLGDDGRPLSFQDVMSRPESGHGLPLAAFYFDILYRDGVELIDQPLQRRQAELESLIAPGSRVSSIVTSDPAEAERFFTGAVADGFEGVVVKDLTQGYEAGRRGTGWLKVKPTHTLDLVVLAAEWGSGRRQGWLSNLHLGARDTDGRFVMLGKTFKGLTDEMLEWQTAAFLEIEERREGHVVYLKPRIVYEIAFDGVQRSTRYPGGVTLRFARVKRHRDDKDPSDADTLDTVRSFLP